MPSCNPAFAARGWLRKLNLILTVAGLATAICFPYRVQSEPLGPPSAPLWLRYPVISPDGKSIAFSFEGHLFIVPSAGGVAQPLTVGPAHDTAPVCTIVFHWLPDFLFQLLIVVGYHSL